MFRVSLKSVFEETDQRFPASVFVKVVVIGAFFGLFAGGVCLAENAADKAPRPFDRLDRAYWEPMEDPGQGRLNEELLDLLVRARSLAAAEEMRRRMRRIAEKREREEKPSPEEDVDIGPVGSLEDLGYSYLKSGKYAQASDIYRELLEINPEDRHAMIMLLFCLRREGRREEAAEIKRELEGMDIDEADIRGIEWMSWVDSLLNNGHDERSDEDE